MATMLRDRFRVSHEDIPADQFRHRRTLGGSDVERSCHCQQGAQSPEHECLAREGRSQLSWEISICCAGLTTSIRSIRAVAANGAPQSADSDSSNGPPAYETRKTPISPFGASIAEYVSPGGTLYPSEKSLKWWMSASMLSFISLRGGGTSL